MSRYTQIATRLSEAIRRNDYSIGEQLPSEVELSSQYQVSRFTIREALRLLREAGIISRRRRHGTQVIARVAPTRYDLCGSSLDCAISCPVDDSCTSRVRRKRITCNSSLGALLECTPGQEWIKIIAVCMRRGTAIPSCVSTSFVDPHAAPCNDVPDHRAKDRSPLLLADRARNAGIMRIEQEIAAILLTGHEARRLRTKMRTPALLVTHRCYGRDGRLIQLSRTIHPNERFTSRLCFVRPPFRWFTQR